MSDSSAVWFTCGLMSPTAGATDLRRARSLARGLIGKRIHHFADVCKKTVSHPAQRPILDCDGRGRKWFEGRSREQHQKQNLALSLPPGLTCCPSCSRIRWRGREDPYELEEKVPLGALRSARPCLRKRTSSASSAQNSLQNNWPFGSRQGCNSPFKVGSCLRQNAQQAAK